MTYVLIAVGAGVGASLRYLVIERLVTAQPQGGFPLGTTIVNVTGCLLIGVMGAVAEERGVFTREARLLLLVGLLGSYTTFSTFGWETLTLLRNNQVATALQYVLVSNVLGLLAVWVGLVATRALWLQR